MLVLAMGIVDVLLLFTFDVSLCGAPRGGRRAARAQLGPFRTVELFPEKKIGPLGSLIFVML